MNVMQLPHLRLPKDLWASMGTDQRNRFLAGKQVTLDEYQMTPAVATWFAAKERHFDINRPFKPEVADQYERSIREGYWAAVHQGIAFSSTGFLIDGQHRLSAVISSGMTVPMNVTLNVSEDSYKHIDQHAIRTVADLLALPKHLANVYKSMSMFAFRANAADDSVLLLRTYEEQVNLMFAKCHAAKAGAMNTMPVKIALAIRLHQFPGSTSYLLNMYRDLVLSNTEHLPAVGHALNRYPTTTIKHRNGVRHRYSSSISSHQTKLMVRAFIAFDPKAKAADIKGGKGGLTEEAEAVIIKVMRALIMTHVRDETSKTPAILKKVAGASEKKEATKRRAEAYERAATQLNAA